MSSCTVLVLAAGRGVRMRSTLPKVLHPLAHRSLLEHVLHAVQPLNPDRIVVVVGHGADRVQQALPPDFQKKISWVIQDQQLGTAHAVQCALPLLPGSNDDDLLILNGDVPLIRTETLRALLSEHREQRRAVTLLTTTLTHPAGYGRIVRGTNGLLQAVVEERDADQTTRDISEINTGTYCVACSHLEGWLHNISNDNAQGEYYLTDIIALAVSERCIVGACHHLDSSEFVGVNTRQQLAFLEKVFRDRLVEEWMERGVAFRDAASCWLAADVTIGSDTVIEPHVLIGPGVQIGSGCSVGPFCSIADTRIGDHCEIKGFSHLEGVSLQACNIIGPFARLRPGTVLKTGARVGNFCETKAAHIGENSKINHLSYVGDATVGSGVNIGAGTITCNYDGERKHRTIIDNDVFIGSGTQLVAPIRVMKQATVGAGSTITRDVPEKALALSRVKQRHISQWSTLRKLQKSQKE